MKGGIQKSYQQYLSPIRHGGLHHLKARGLILLKRQPARSIKRWLGVEHDVCFVIGKTLVLIWVVTGALRGVSDATTPCGTAVVKPALSTLWASSALENELAKTPDGQRRLVEAKERKDRWTYEESARLAEGESAAGTASGDVVAEEPINFLSFPS